ncbi:MAG: carboxypeptidase regulatory-like domain-containing protein [Deltaproteobacteria bacterium]|nr:carboxypeptidase regulatory-like domain-containing protein [Deltaproteobacteria bacterium]
MRRAALLLLLLLGNAPVTPAGAVSGTVVVVHEGKRVPVEGNYVHVYLRPAKLPPKAPGIGQTFDVIQKDKQFDPHVIVVPKGATVRFPNKDTGETHNVFWSDEPHKDLGRRTATDPVQTYEFDDAQEFSVYCDIHQQMWAKILVVDSTYIAKVDKDGHYTIPNVAPGTYQVVVWAPSSTPVVSEKLTVTDGQTSIAKELHLQLTPLKCQHNRKDGSPYPPYAGQKSPC